MKEFLEAISEHYIVSAMLFWFIYEVISLICDAIKTKK